MRARQRMAYREAAQRLHAGAQIEGEFRFDYPDTILLLAEIRLKAATNSPAGAGVNRSAPMDFMMAPGENETISSRRANQIRGRPNDGEAIVDPVRLERMAPPTSGGRTD